VAPRLATVPSHLSAIPAVTPAQARARPETQVHIRVTVPLHYRGVRRVGTECDGSVAIGQNTDPVVLRTDAPDREYGRFDAQPPPMNRPPPPLPFTTTLCTDTKGGGPKEQPKIEMPLRVLPLASRRSPEN